MRWRTSAARWAAAFGTTSRAVPASTAGAPLLGRWQGPGRPGRTGCFPGTLLSQHISFLRDVFRVYKGFRHAPHRHAGADGRAVSSKSGTSPTARTLPECSRRITPSSPTCTMPFQECYDHYEAADSLYPREMLRDLLLGLHSMCRGADARFFNGHTNIARSKFLVFCVKGLDNMAKNLRNTLLFSLLSLYVGSASDAGAIPWLPLTSYTCGSPIPPSSPTSAMPSSGCEKGIRPVPRQPELEDFSSPGIRELTRPLFSIPVHQFIFNGGNVDKKFFMDNLQLEESEYAPDPGPAARLLPLQVRQ